MVKIGHWVDVVAGAVDDRGLIEGPVRGVVLAVDEGGETVTVEASGMIGGVAYEPTAFVFQAAEVVAISV